MPRAVYSTRFIGLATASTATQIYEVPAGFVAVVRDVTAVLAGEAGASAYLVCEVPSITLLALVTATTASTEGEYRGSSVFNAGETLEAAIYSSTGGSLICSGYLLAL